MARRSSFERHKMNADGEFAKFLGVAGPKERPKNESGMRPVEYKVLVKLDPTEEKTAGGIIIPEQRQERNQMAETYATLIEVGGNAFEDWKPPIPKPGDRILISKYAGQTPKAGDTDDLYRLCVDKDVVAVVDG